VTPILTLSLNSGAEMSTTISEANNTLNELHLALEHAYWEASSIDKKDLFYDLISAVNKELSELGKLSIQDHHMDYEPISVELRRAKAKLTDLRKLLDECVARTATACRLEELITDVVTLYSH
jgi:hypothetical protein